MAVEQLLAKLRVVVFLDRIGPCASREHFCLVFLQRPTEFLAHNTCAMNICWMNTWKNWGNNNLTTEWDKRWSGKELWATPACVPMGLEAPCACGLPGDLPEQAASQTPPPRTLTLGQQPGLHTWKVHSRWCDAGVWGRSWRTEAGRWCAAWKPSLKL